MTISDLLKNIFVFGTPYSRFYTPAAAVYIANIYNHLLSDHHLQNGPSKAPISLDTLFIVFPSPVGIIKQCSSLSSEEYYLYRGVNKLK